jgi:hypothetical protein
LDVLREACILVDADALAVLQHLQALERLDRPGRGGALPAG